MGKETAGTDSEGNKKGIFMKIFIDITVLTMVTFVTGIQRVTREFLVRLIESNSCEVVLMHYNAAEDTYYRIENEAFLKYYVQGKGIKERMITKEPVAISSIGAGTIFFDLDAVWMCRMKRSYLLPILKKQGARIIVHVYDIISITHPQYCLDRGVYNFMDYIGAHLQFADRIIVNAQATVEELKKLSAKVECKLPPCYVVPLGADFKVRKTVTESEVSQELVEAVKVKPFVLMVGTIEPRKNHKLVLNAYEQKLKAAGYNLIFAGYIGWNMEEFEQRLINHEDFGKGVYHFSGLDDTAITYLYQHAVCLAFCSYMEGFGLPIIEALQRGTPVVAADVPVLREVGGDNCCWFEQDNIDDFCEKIEYCHKNREDICSKATGLNVVTWENSFNKLSKVLINEQ